MNSEINFKDLWSGQKTEPPTTEALLLKVTAFKKSNRKKIIFTNVSLAATSLFILCIWYFYQPQWISTKFGIVLIILAMVIFVIPLNKSLGLLKTTHEIGSNQAYLKTLLDLKAKQKFMQTTMLNIYFLMLSTGIALYFYEYTAQMTTFWAVFSYAITGLWLLFNWFFLRPKQIKKQQSKLQDIIQKFETLQSQLHQD